MSVTTPASRCQTGPWPTCPDCRSDRAKCVRPSGHDAPAWHLAREDAMAEVCRCPQVCIPWLARRATTRKKATRR